MRNDWRLLTWEYMVGEAYMKCASKRQGRSGCRSWVRELGGVGTVNTILKDGGRSPGQPVAEAMTGQRVQGYPHNYFERRLIRAII